jgi:hypothetical protein
MVGRTSGSSEDGIGESNHSARWANSQGRCPLNRETSIEARTLPRCPVDQFDVLCYVASLSHKPECLMRHHYHSHEEPDSGVPPFPP